MDATLSPPETPGRPKPCTPSDANTPSNQDERERAESLAAHWRLPLITPADVTVQPDALCAVPEQLVRKVKRLPIRKEAPDENRKAGVRPTLLIAIANPADLSAIDQIEFASGCRVRLAVATSSEIEQAIDRHYSPERWIAQLIEDVEANEVIQVVETSSDSESVAQAPAVKLVNLILQKAVELGANDIHLEPTAQGLLVRYRVAGLLQEFMTFPQWLQRPLIARVKVLANLDVADHRRPQDGRMRVQLLTKETDVRVSTLPAQFGEKVVLRLLGSTDQIPALPSLGFSPDDLMVMQGAIAQPQGMILVTGPTGSGKTTTLYSVLNARRDPSINIVTVEDPIEIQMPGINQIQINNKAEMTFAACLRSVLRQDPDIILVGEIRDKETQEIAFHAAQTGHLVLSTLPTNGTVETISRLLDLGVEPRAITETVHLIIAQRLLRSICSDCRGTYMPSASALRQLRLDNCNLQFWRGRGCKSCGETGYRGRFGVYEVLRMTSAIRDLVAGDAKEPELRRAAAAAGTRRLVDQGIMKVAAGVTTVEEVLRVIAVEADEQGMDVCNRCGHELQDTWTICPVCAAPRFRHESSPRGGQPDSGSPRVRILVVDDDSVSRTIAMRALQQLPGHPDVVVAPDGHTALAMASRIQPDMVVLDVMIPGIDGVEVCRKLRQNLKTAFIPVLMLTASESEEHRLQGFVAGTDDYMQKPVSVPELHARVNRLLQRSNGNGIAAGASLAASQTATRIGAEHLC